MKGWRTILAQVGFGALTGAMAVADYLQNADFTRSWKYIAIITTAVFVSSFLRYITTTPIGRSE